MKVPNVRFNLKFYDSTGAAQDIRSLVDLREKCNLSDLYDYFEAGVLERWLSAQGERGISESVTRIHSEPDLAKRLKKLVSVLSLGNQDRNIDDIVFVHQHQSHKPRTVPEGTVVEQPPSYLDLIAELFGAKCDMGRVDSWKMCLLKPLRKILKYYAERFFNDIRCGLFASKYLSQHLGRVLLLLCAHKKWGTLSKCFLNFYIETKSDAISVKYKNVDEYILMHRIDIAWED